MGNIATYNEGLRNARGEFLVMLSADDRYNPYFFEKALDMFETYPEIGMLYTDSEIIDAKGIVQKRKTNSNRKKSGIYKDELKYLVFGCNIPHSAAIVRKEVFTNVGLYNPEFTRSGDWELWLRITKKYPIGYIKKPLYQYRRHGVNMSMSLDTVLKVNQENKKILDIFFSDATLPKEIKAIKKNVYSYKQFIWSLRYFRARCWSNGFREMLNVLKSDLKVLCSIKRLLSIGYALFRGIFRKQ